MHMGQCSSYLLGELCKDLSEQKAIPINIYKDKLICKKPLPSNYTMFDMVLPVLNDNACPEGLKMCGRFTYKYYKVCLPKEIKCPINDLKIVDLTDDIKG